MQHATLMDVFEAGTRLASPFIQDATERLKQQNDLRLKNDAARFAVDIQDFTRDYRYSGDEQKYLNDIQRFTDDWYNKAAAENSSPYFQRQTAQMRELSKIHARDTALEQADKWRWNDADVRRERTFESVLASDLPAYQKFAALDAANELWRTERPVDPAQFEEARQNGYKALYDSAIEKAAARAENADGVEAAVKSVNAAFAHWMPKTEIEVTETDAAGGEVKKKVTQPWTFPKKGEVERQTIAGAVKLIQQRHYDAAARANAERERDIQDYRVLLAAGDGLALALTRNINGGKYGGRTWEEWRGAIDRNEGGNYAADKLPQMKGWFDRWAPAGTKEGGTKEGGTGGAKVEKTAPQMNDRVAGIIQMQREGRLADTLLGTRETIWDLLWDGREEGLPFALSQAEKNYYNNDRQLFINQNFKTVYTAFTNEAINKIKAEHGDITNIETLWKTVNGYDRLDDAGKTTLRMNMEHFFLATPAARQTAGEIDREAGRIVNLINHLRVQSVLNSGKTADIRAIENYGKTGGEGNRVKAKEDMALLPQIVNRSAESGSPYFITPEVEAGVKRLEKAEREDFEAAGYTVKDMHFSSGQGESERDGEIGGQMYYSTDKPWLFVRQVVRDGKLVIQERAGSFNRRGFEWGNEWTDSPAPATRQLKIKAEDERAGRQNVDLMTWIDRSTALPPKNFESAWGDGFSRTSVINDMIRGEIKPPEMSDRAWEAAKADGPPAVERAIINHYRRGVR